MVDLGTYTSVNSYEGKDDDNKDVDTDAVIESLNYMDYVPSDMDENSETLPRHNRSNSRPSPPAVELCSLFQPKDDEQHTTTTSLFAFEDSETDSPARKSNGVSSYQTTLKQNDLPTPRMSGRTMTSSSDSPPTTLSSIIERQQRRGSGVWGIMRPKKPDRSRTVFPPGSAVGELSSLGSIREEDNSEDEDDEDPLMEVMDYLEDEIDEYTYDELIPLQIRMALEDQIFGWDHFFSSMLGHVVYTVGSYFITFWFITFLCLREVPWGSGKVDEFTDTTTKSNPWGMPHGLFSFIRTAISLGSAISTFRTIRRRRRVWLRPSRGDERRKHSMEEADQRASRFVLGSKLWSKMRRSYEKRREKYLARGVSRKLQKAQKMFEKRHKNRVQLIRSTSNSSLSSLGSKKKRAVASALTRQGHESSHHERVRMLASAGRSRKRLDSDYSTDNDDGSVGGSSVGESSNSDVRSYHNSMPGYVGDSHTLPNFAMESVSHDQMPFASGEIKNVPYVHGGFFGAAPFMLTNPFWIKILRLLMPDVYVEIARRASYAPAPKLIHWAENNPVVAAYGTAHEVEFSGKVPTLEWDVFLDPYLVRRVEIVLSEKETFVKKQKDLRKKSREANGSSSRVVDGEASPLGSKSEDAAALASADVRLVLSYYDKEIRRRTEILVDRMLIAHGNVAQLVMEQTGYFKKYNFSRVKRTRKTLGGGIFARQWVAVYAEAMSMGMEGFCDEDEDDDISDSGTDGSIETREDLDFGGENDFVDTNDDGRNIEMSRSPKPKSKRTSSATRSDIPPEKIVMTRNEYINDDDDDDDMSASTDDSSQRSKRQGSRKKHRRKKLTRSQLNPTSLRAAFCPDMSIKESISMLKPILQCSAPLGILMDMKSRHVSKRVWALVIDYLRDAGARVEGVASFIVDEIRDISQYCSSPVNEIVFIHSAGDLQHGCHTGQIKRRDRVFFNAGSLLWDYPNLYAMETVKSILCHRLHPCFDEHNIKESYRLKAYARTTKNSPQQSESEAETCDESTLGDGDSLDTELFARLIVADRKRKALADPGQFTYEEVPDNICSTIQDYKEHYQLSIGLYVQEFAIDEVAISLIVKYVNSNPHVYDLGLSWGGINGLTVKGIQPGRFTATDGLWNQRYGGMPWIRDKNPSDFLPPMSPGE
jgi:hypothetical protein